MGDRTKTGNPDRSVPANGRTRGEDEGRRGEDAAPFLAVMVSFRLRPGTIERFVRLILASAHASIEREQGCLQFDVIVPEDTADHVVLYELYRTREAFALHVETEHYSVFAKKSTDLVLEKTVHVGRRLDGSPKPCLTNRELA